MCLVCSPTAVKKIRKILQDDGRSIIQAIDNMKVELVDGKYYHANEVDSQNSVA